MPSPHDDLIGPLALLLLALLFLVLCITWDKALVAAKVELSIIKRSSRLRFLGEVAILFAMAFFIAEILANARFVRSDAFGWILIGLPICFLLGRFWWRKYR